VVTGVVVPVPDVAVVGLAAVDPGEEVDPPREDPVLDGPPTGSDEQAATPKTITARPALPMSLRRRRRLMRA
jgi:hypothetical protein